MTNKKQEPIAAEEIIEFNYKVPKQKIVNIDVIYSHKLPLRKDWLTFINIK